MCLSIAVEAPERVLSKGEHLGLQWVTTHNTMGYRCGYVRLPQGHPWYGLGYDDVPADCHGGITFAEADVPCDAPGPDVDWWIGFDCAHAFDAPDPGLPVTIGVPITPLYPEGVIRSQEYVEDHCRSLCEQAVAAAAGLR